jgi:hypothetical protein
MKKISVLVLVLCLVGAALFAQGKKQQKPASAKDLMKGFDIKKSTDVIAPSPAEIFVALDKLAKSQKNFWQGLAGYNTRADYNNRFSQGLNLGIRVADAFVAIQSEDAASLGKMSGSIVTLAGKLGVEQTVLSYSDSINALVRTAKPEWSLVRTRVEDMRSGVTQTMKKLDDEAVVTLATVAGWIEGLRIVTKALDANYSEAGAKLLRQPYMIEYYKGQLNKLPAEAKKLESVIAISSKIDEIKKICDVKKGKAVSKDDLKKLQVISAEIVSLIEGGK